MTVYTVRTTLYAVTTRHWFVRMMLQFPHQPLLLRDTACHYLPTKHGRSPTWFACFTANTAPSIASAPHA